ncbi:hypothetical protein Bca4012_094560 [Brassica carinata]
MGVFPGFGSWINQNSQQPLKAESKRSENGESKSASEKDTNNAPAKKKEEVTNKKGLYHMNIELTVGMTPNIVYYVLTESDPFFDRKKWRDLMKNTSRKVLKRMVRGGSSW